MRVIFFFCFVGLVLVDCFADIFFFRSCCLVCTFFLVAAFFFCSLLQGEVDSDEEVLTLSSVSCSDEEELTCVRIVVFCGFGLVLVDCFADIFFFRSCCLVCTFFLVAAFFFCSLLQGEVDSDEVELEQADDDDEDDDDCRHRFFGVACLLPFLPLEGFFVIVADDDEHDDDCDDDEDSCADRLFVDCLVAGFLRGLVDEVVELSCVDDVVHVAELLFADDEGEMDCCCCCLR